MSMNKLTGLILISLLCTACSGSLHNTVLVKDEDDVIKEIKRSQRVDIRNYSGNTPLHLAARRGLIRPVQTLVEQGANINARDFNGRSPFMIALREGHGEVAQYLLDQGTVLESNYKYANPLADAAYSNNIEMIEKVIAAGIEVDKVNKDGETALHAAAGHGHSEAVQALLDQGADKNKLTASGWTPLLSTALNSHHQTIDVLLAAGASPTASDTSEYHAKATGILYEYLAEKTDPATQRKHLDLATHYYHRSAELYGLRIKEINNQINSAHLKNFAMMMFAVVAANAMPGTTVPTSSGGLATIKPPVFVPLQGVRSASDLKKLLEKEQTDMQAAAERCATRLASL